MQKISLLILVGGCPSGASFHSMDLQQVSKLLREGEAGVMRLIRKPGQGFAG
jgi:hypothetical protein